MKLLYRLIILGLIIPISALGATNTVHDKTLKATPLSTDETYVWDIGTSSLKKTTFAFGLVGDCTSFPCLDGSSDGGNYIKLWSGSGAYWTALQAGASAANRSWRLPIAAAPAAGETLVMTMDEYGQMSFLAKPSTSGYVLSSTNAGVLSWEPQSGGSGTLNDLTDVDTTGAANGSILKYNGSAWVVGVDSTGSGSVPDGTVNGQVLLWSTDQWVASTAPWLSSYPGAGIPNSTGSAWGTSYTLDTDMSSVSANDDTIPSAKAVDATYAKKSGISFVAGALADMKILTTAQPVNGENLVDDTVAYGATEDQLRLWSIDKVGSQLALKLNATALDDTKGNGDTAYIWSADKVYDQLVLKRSVADEKKEVCWFVTASDTATAVADGKQAFVVPASMNGMLLTDMTCAVHDLNSAASGATTVVLRRVRGATAADMTSTGVTINYDEYSASDETVDTANDDLATGDKVYVDVNAITTAAQKGLTCTAVFSNP